MEHYLGKLLGGRYQIIEVVGVGGMAVVYRAQDIVLKRDVAVKILKEIYAQSPDIRKRFSIESQAVAQLSHQNIVSIYDVGSENDVDYIVMELMEGVTLKEYLRTKGRLDWTEALYFAQQISLALLHAHSRGIIHQDVKPQNVIITRDGTLKLTDFGIASFATTQETRVVQEAIGSVHYVSPEQAKGKQIDYRTDLYSLGIVMYEMLTGVMPFEGDTALQIVMQHLNTVPPVPSAVAPDIPPGMDEIVMHAMCANINRRYASAQEIFQDLEKLRNDPSIYFGYNIGKNMDAAETQIISPEVRRAARKTPITEEQPPVYRYTESDPIPEEEPYTPTQEQYQQQPYQEQYQQHPYQEQYQQQPYQEPYQQQPYQEPYYEETPSQYRERARYEDDLPPEPYTFFDRLAERPTLAAGIAISIFAVFALVVTGVLLATGKGNGKISMPQLVGQSVDVVMQDSELTEFFILTENEPRQESDSPVGEILEQDPEQGWKVSKGTEVKLTVSAGKEEQTDDDKQDETPKNYVVSNLIGKTLDDIAQELQEYDIQTKTHEEYNRDYPNGQIIRTEPSAGQEIKPGGTLTLYISLGKKIEQVPVPDVLGLTEAAAKSALESKGFHVVLVDPIESESEKGSVVWQSINNGTSANLGATIQIQLSLGKSEPTPPPDEETTPDNNDHQDDAPSEPSNDTPTIGSAAIDVALPTDTDMAHVVILIDDNTIAYDGTVETNAGSTSITVQSTVGSHKVSVSIDGNPSTTSDYMFTAPEGEGGTS